MYPYVSEIKPSLSRLKTIVMGNSIPGYSWWDDTTKYWSPYATIHLANALSGQAMTFAETTASARMDTKSIYSYSGQTSTTILADLDANLFAPIDALPLYPDLVLVYGFFENDIAAAASDITSTLLTNAVILINTLKAKWPGVKIIFCTPLPGFGNNTATKVALFASIRNAILPLHNNIDIFVCDVSKLYENPSSPATPLGTAGTPIWTDATVHPSAKGALSVARQLSKTILRIGSSWLADKPSVSANFSLSGSNAHTGTNSTGTIPNNMTYAGSAGITAAVLTALNPGLQVSMTCPASASIIDTSSITFSSYSLPVAATKLSGVIKVQIVSGAENLRSLDFTFRTVDGTGNFNTYFILYSADGAQSTTQREADFQNGEIYTLRTAPIAARSGSITATTSYIKVTTKLAGGNVVVKFISQSVEVYS